MKKPSMQIGFGVALGAGIGAAIAVVLGSGGAWLAIGIVVGIVIGMAMSKRKDSAPVRNDGRSLGQERAWFPPFPPRRAKDGPPIFCCGF